MTGLIANVLLNVILVGLLSATILYCYVLNRRIQVLQDSKSDLASLLKQFDESTVKASETIVAMQSAGKKIGDNIQLRIDKANYLLDDLSFSIEKAGRLTNQLEAGIAVHRARNKTQHEEQGDDTAAHLSAGHAEHGFPIASEAEPSAVSKPTQHREPNKRVPSSIEDLLEKVVSRKQHQQQDTVSMMPAKTTASSRSRAEQELVDLIRNSRG